MPTLLSEAEGHTSKRMSASACATPRGRRPQARVAVSLHGQTFHSVDGGTSFSPVARLGKAIRGVVCHGRDRG